MDALLFFGNDTLINVTRTAMSHYEVQKKRRAKFIEDWRDNYRTVIHLRDVEMHKTPRGLTTGVYLGKEGGRPVRTVDAAATKTKKNVPKSSLKSLLSSRDGSLN